MPAPYPVMAVVNWMIERNKPNPANLTHLKIQKLLFITQGNHLREFGIPLFDEDFNAWRYGPIVDKVYQQLKGFGGNEIFTKIHSHTFAFKSSGPWEAATAIDEDDDRTLDFLERYWTSYSRMSNLDLVSMSSRDSGPWRQIAGSIQSWDATSAIVPKELIKFHFCNYQESPPARKDDAPSRRESPPPCRDSYPPESSPSI